MIGPPPAGDARQREAEASVLRPVPGRVVVRPTRVSAPVATSEWRVTRVVWAFQLSLTSSSFFLLATPALDLSLALESGLPPRGSAVYLPFGHDRLGAAIGASSPGMVPDAEVAELADAPA